MKIGLICPYSIARGGGVQEHVLAVQAELNKRGHDAWLLTPQHRGNETAPAPERKLIFVGGSVDFNSLSTTAQVSASVNDTIDEVLAEHEFDLLHFHEPWVPMLSAQILSRSHCVNVATFHAKLPETIVARTMIKVVTPYTKSVLKYIDACTAVSEAAADYVSTVTDQPITLIPNGINVDFYNNPEPPDDSKATKTIFYVGRFEQRKGTKHLLQAFKLLTLERPDISLILASDGPDRPKLEALVEELEIPNVTFLGFISDEEKLHYLRTSDLFCSPALHGESFGVVLLEAMATGIVTVAGDNPGYKCVMKDFGEISLVNPKHHEDFARRLKLLLYQNDLRKLWRKWAAKELPKYSFATIVDGYERVYERAIAEHRERNDSDD